MRSLSQVEMVHILFSRSPHNILTTRKSFHRLSHACVCYSLPVSMLMKYYQLMKNFCLYFSKNLSSLRLFCCQYVSCSLNFIHHLSISLEHKPSKKKDILDCFSKTLTLWNKIRRKVWKQRARKENHSAGLSHRHMTELDYQSYLSLFFEYLSLLSQLVMKNKFSTYGTRCDSRIINLTLIKPD